uniref:Competence damage-inducible protein A n=1 Tax=Streptococcus pneumoniae TaxID=1313 RepID=A0A4J2B3N0_STREE|nr:competence damage-inducible protein A [Streptococcus pneumoniae]
MKKFDNYIIEKPCDSNSDKLQKILIIENLVDDILQFPLRINQNHQCELVVCSAAISRFYRPGPKAHRNSFLAHHFPEQVLKHLSYFLLFISPVNGSTDSNNVSWSATLSSCN